MMNNEKEFEEVLNHVGEKATLEEFGWEGENHVFSKSYERQKEMLLKRANNRQGKVIQCQKKKTTIGVGFPKKRIAMFAIVAMIAMGIISVAATAYLNWSRSLSEGLQATEEQKLQMEKSKMTAFLAQSVTDNGITVTAIQSFTDNYYAHIIFKVDGYKIEDDVQPDFERIDVTVDGKDDTGYGGSFYNGLIMDETGKAVYVDGTPFREGLHGYVMEDGSLEFWLTLNSRDEAPGYFIDKPVHIELKNLGTVAKAEYENRTDGVWSFDFNLQGSADMKECLLNAPLGDSKATVIRAEISPMSLMVQYDFPRLNAADNDDNANTALFEEPPHLTGIKLKDGTLYPFVYFGPGRMGYESNESDVYTMAFAIDRIIDVEQVESLLFIKSYPGDGLVPTEDNFYVVPID